MASKDFSESNPPASLPTKQDTLAGLTPEQRSEHERLLRVAREQSAGVKRLIAEMPWPENWPPPLKNR